MQKKDIKSITVTRNTSASGVSISEGKVLSVPCDISSDDAWALVRCGKAVVMPEASDEVVAEASDEVVAEASDEVVAEASDEVAQVSNDHNRRGRRN